MNQMRRAIAVASTETRRDDPRVGQRECRACPFTFQPCGACTRPDIDHMRVLQQIVNVPEAFLLFPAMSLDARAQAIQGAANVNVIAARESEHAQRADANRLGTREENHKRVGAAICLHSICIVDAHHKNTQRDLLRASVFVVSLLPTQILL